MSLWGSSTKALFAGSLKVKHGLESWSSVAAVQEFEGSMVGLTQGGVAVADPKTLRSYTLDCLGGHPGGSLVAGQRPAPRAPGAAAAPPPPPPRGAAAGAPTARAPRPPSLQAPSTG